MTIDVRWWEWLWWIHDFQIQIKTEFVRFQVPISYVTKKIWKINYLLLLACLSVLKIKIDDKIIINDRYYYYFLPLLLVLIIIIVQTTSHCVIVAVFIIIDMMRCFIINFIENLFLYCYYYERNAIIRKHLISDNSRSEQQLNILPFIRNFVRKQDTNDAKEREKTIIIECDRCDVEKFTRTTDKKNYDKFMIENKNTKNNKKIMQKTCCCDQNTCNEQTKWNMKEIFLSLGQGIELLLKILLFSSSVCKTNDDILSWKTTTTTEDNETKSENGKQEPVLSSRRKSTTNQNVYITFLLLFTCIPLIAGSSIHANVKYSTNIIKTKYGPLRGILVRTNPPVEAFLGVPYATPPVGSLR